MQHHQPAAGPPLHPPPPTLKSLLDPVVRDGTPDLPEDSAEGTWFCQACKEYMRPGTKHCAPCNKCVSGFDHHCVWLNTCVGARNYAPFFGLLNAAVAMLAGEAAAAAALLAASFLRGARFAEALAEAYPRSGAPPPWAHRAALAGVALLSAALLAALAGLWVTHWVLLARGVTTWDMIRAHLELRRTSSSGGQRGGPGGLCPGGQVAPAPQEPGARGALGSGVSLGSASTGPGTDGSRACSGTGSGAAGGSGGKPRGKHVAISPLSALRMKRPPRQPGARGAPRHGRCRACGGATVTADDGGFDAAASPAAPSASSSPRLLPSLQSPHAAQAPSSPGGSARTGAPGAGALPSPAPQREQRARLGASSGGGVRFAVGGPGAADHV